MLVFTNPEPAIKLSEEQAKNLGIDITKDEMRGELKTRGVWSIPVSYKAIAASSKFGKKEGSFFDGCLESSFYGIRTMSNIRQSGYELEGYVSINGKKYSCFTSSQLFEVNGKLIDVAIIHARVK
jgi:hypothetical protein